MRFFSGAFPLMGCKVCKLCTKLNCCISRPTQTVRFKDELERNITIRLGYANAKIYKCDNDSCPRPDCYRSEPSNKVDTFPCERPGCGGSMQVIRYGAKVIAGNFLWTEEFIRISASWGVAMYSGTISRV
jgi:hypothetical protein